MKESIKKLKKERFEDLFKRAILLLLYLLILKEYWYGLSVISTHAQSISLMFVIIQVLNLAVRYLGYTIKISYYQWQFQREIEAVINKKVNNCLDKLFEKIVSLNKKDTIRS